MGTATGQIYCSNSYPSPGAAQCSVVAAGATMPSWGVWCTHSWQGDKPECRYSPAGSVSQEDGIWCSGCLLQSQGAHVPEDGFTHGPPIFAIAGATVPAGHSGFWCQAGGGSCFAVQAGEQAPTDGYYYDTQQAIKDQHAAGGQGLGGNPVFCSSSFPFGTGAPTGAPSTAPSDAPTEETR